MSEKSCDSEIPSDEAIEELFDALLEEIHKEEKFVLMLGQEDPDHN